MRARTLPGHENTKCPRGFNYALWHSRNWPKIKVFRPVITKKTLQAILNPIFGTVECSTEEAITSQSSTLPMAFRSGFLPISPKTGFFHAKCVSKRSPTAFLVVVTLCSITLKVLGCFLFIFATAVANTLSARARTKKSTQKCQKSRFCDFCTKNRTFFAENRCKSTH